MGWVGCDNAHNTIRKEEILMNMKTYLTDDILSFWLKTAFDKENGGVFTSLDRDGTVYGTDKSVWFQGRTLWTYSKAYNFIEKRKEYLDAAKLCYDFLPKCTDVDGRMFFSVTKEGRELQKRRYYYSETFAAIGCAEYYKATGDISIWNTAEKYFDVAYGIYSGKTPTVPKVNPLNAPYKAVAPSMIMLNTAQIMATAGINSEKYISICKECMAEIMHGGFIKSDLGGMLEQVNLDGSFADTPSTRVVNPGHSLECAWFLMAAGLKFGSDEAIAKGKEIIDITMPLGTDKAHGGLISFADISGKPPMALEWDMKLWWPQCETIIANRLAYAIFGEEKYLENYNTFLDYAMKNFADTEFGEWYGYLHYDNTVANSLKGNLFKGPFHLPRMVMTLHDFNENGNMNKFLL